MRPVPHTVRPPLTRPDDFDRFWAETLAVLRRVPIEYEVGTIAAAPEGATLAPVRFRSLGDVWIRGFLLTREPGSHDAASPRRPLAITTHGYNSQSNPAAEARHVAQGVDVFCFDVRGFGLSRTACMVDPDGYVLTDHESPHTSILRGAVCDYIRAADVGIRLHRSPTERVTFHGRSFAGGLAIMAQAVSHYASYLAVAVPTFGWAAGRRVLVKKGSGREINDHVAAGKAREAEIMHTLRYFDTVNFADRVGCPSLVGVGSRDDVVPAETVFAIVNHMVPSPEVVELPVSHSDDPQEAQWEEFDRRWVADAVARSSST
jgi:cephalosporin-C deacetylase